MFHKITLIHGDGIGPEVVSATAKIIEASGVKVDWDEQRLGLKALDRDGSTVPQKTLESIKKNRVALKGPTTTPIGAGHRSANVALRKALDLYACIRPVKSLPGVLTPYRNVDLVVVRENTEGLYAGHELKIAGDCVLSLRVMTEKGCVRIAKKAFDYAIENGRKKVCAVHKANILKLGDGLLLACADRVRADYHKIDYESAIIDALCMRLVIAPQGFDVLFMENLFGDIVSDLCAGLVGGLGVVPGANIGDECAVFEAVHGSAPDITGMNVANPTATIQSSIMMLRHLRENSAAQRIEASLFRVLGEKDLRTKDLGGSSSTEGFANHVIDGL